MAASDKTKSGNWADYVRHLGFIMGGKPICGNKKAGYVTTDENEVDCKICKKKITPPFIFIFRSKKYFSNGDVIIEIVHEGTFIEVSNRIYDRFPITQYEILEGKEAQYYINKARKKISKI